MSENDPKGGGGGSGGGGAGGDRPRTMPAQPRAPQGAKGPENAPKTPENAQKTPEIAPNPAVVAPVDLPPEDFNRDPHGAAIATDPAPRQRRPGVSTRDEYREAYRALLAEDRDAAMAFPNPDGPGLNIDYETVLEAIRARRGGLKGVGPAESIRG